MRLETYSRIMPRNPCARVRGWLTWRILSMACRFPGQSINQSIAHLDSDHLRMNIVIARLSSNQPQINSLTLQMFDNPLPTGLRHVNPGESNVKETCEMKGEPWRKMEKRTRRWSFSTQGECGAPWRWDGKKWFVLTIEILKLGEIPKPKIQPQSWPLHYRELLELCPSIALVHW